MSLSRIMRRTGAAVTTAVLAVGLATAPSAVAHPPGRSGLTRHERANLLSIARDTWRFYGPDVDPKTHLPLDNLGPGSTRGNYTSAANIGVYLWAVTSAYDLHIITKREADKRLRQTLTEVRGLKRSYGFLYQWYDTDNGNTLLNPGQGDCAETTPSQDNCWFLSAVDNGWYASGLIVVKHAFPKIAGLADKLLKPMNFSIFYDNRPQTSCNTNQNLSGNPPTGQMHGGYYVKQGPAGYWNSALYSDPRIAMYIGMGRHQMPGDVWWRSWRVLPPKQCSTDPDFSWQGQPKPQGYWVNQKDPLSGKTFRVWEGHYTYPGTSMRFLPTFGGGMFEALMANEVVPETTWGKHSFGLADKRTAEVQIKYATQKLGYPVWGMSPSSTADDTGDYGGFGVEGLAFPKGKGLSQCTTCAEESTVTPHASFLALDVTPHAAYANIQKLRSLYPDIYTHNGGFYDAVNPSTGEVGHRRLVLDQSMIMAALDNALNHRRLQHWFAMDPTANAARLVLRAEHMSL